MTININENNLKSLTKADAKSKKQLSAGTNNVVERRDLLCFGPRGTDHGSNPSSSYSNRQYRRMNYYAGVDGSYTEIVQSGNTRLKECNTIDVVINYFGIYQRATGSADFFDRKEPDSSWQDDLEAGPKANVEFQVYASQYPSLESSDGQLTGSTNTGSFETIINEAKLNKEIQFALPNHGPPSYRNFIANNCMYSGLENSFCYFDGLDQFGAAPTSNYETAILTFELSSSFNPNVPLNLLIQVNDIQEPTFLDPNDIDQFLPTGSADKPDPDYLTIQILEYSVWAYKL